MELPVVLPSYQYSMSVIYILLTISLVVALVFLCAFFIAVRRGQFDDSYTPSVRILFDDELVTEKTNPGDTTQVNTKPSQASDQGTEPETDLEINSKDKTNIQLSLTKQSES